MVSAAQMLSGKGLEHVKVALIAKINAKTTKDDSILL